MLARTHTFVAAADLSAAQYTFQKCDNTGKIATAANGGQANGVLQDAPAAGGPGCVAISGVCRVKAGAAIAAGALVQSDANGKAITAVANSYIHGMALDQATGANDIILIQLMIGNAKA